MKPETRFRRYDPADFLLVRDFLASNYLRFPEPVNWDIVRWNYARYFCAPMLGARGLGEAEEKIPDTTGKKSNEAIAFWESSIGVWETNSGEIAGVVCPDEYTPWHPAFGQAFLQRSPDYEHLIGEMLEYSQRTFIGIDPRNPLRTRNTTRIYVGETDKALGDVAKGRGFVKDEKPVLEYMEFDLTDIPEPILPRGYRFVSMAENNDIEKRRKITGLSFRHPDPDDWPTAYSYKELQKAPDYHKELDIVVERPDGEWVSCTIAWFDEVNGRGTIEPLGSIQLGMGREVALEALRRLKARGAEVARMDSGLEFYKKIGFRRRFSIYRWVKTHNYL
jgi:predicted N-acetyltransferase YhbS